MAIRYSGGLKINVVYRDKGDYRAVITDLSQQQARHSTKPFPFKTRSMPARKAVVYVNPAPAGFGRGVAYDSPQAYDEIAHAALSFADEDLRVKDREDWVSSLAAYDREGQGWHIGRTERQAWPKP